MSCTQVLFAIVGGVVGGAVVCAIDYVFRVRPLKKDLARRAGEIRRE